MLKELLQRSFEVPQPGSPCHFERTAATSAAVTNGLGLGKLR